MNPAMIVTVVLGLWLAFGADAVDWRAGWVVHAKIALVVLMLVLHGCWPNGARISRPTAFRTANVSSALSTKCRRCC